MLSFDGEIINCNLSLFDKIIDELMIWLEAYLEAVW